MATTLPVPTISARGSLRHSDPPANTNVPNVSTSSDHVYIQMGVPGPIGRITTGPPGTNQEIGKQGGSVKGVVDWNRYESKNYEPSDTESSHSRYKSDNSSRKKSSGDHKKTKPPKGNKKQELIARSILDMEARVQGKLDCTKQLLRDAEDSVKEKSAPVVTKPIIIQPQPIKADIHATFTFEDLVQAHFIAFEYSDKSLSTAKTNLVKWRSVTKSKRTIMECLDYIYRTYENRDFRQSHWSKLVGWARDWWYNNSSRVKAFTVAAYTSFVGAATLWMKSQFGLSIPGGILAALLCTVGLVKLVYNQYYRPPSRLIQAKQCLGVLTYCTNQKLTVDKDQIDEKAGVTLPPHVVANHRCQPKVMPVGFSFGIDYLWIPRNCLHNELNALVTRQLQPRIPVSPEGILSLRMAMDRIIAFYPQVTISHHKDIWVQLFLNKYPLNRRNMIQRAMKNNMLVDVKMKGFPKIEVMVGKPVASRKVRFISNFDDGYLAETGPEYYLWQKEMIKQMWAGSVEDTQYVYTGGMTGDRIGDWFSQQMAEGRVLLLLDFSKFDSRNKDEVLTQLYRFYESQLGPELTKWLQHTWNKEGRTSHGILYNVIATVASGRIDTSFGNTNIVFMLVTAGMMLLDNAYVEDMRVSALGDDNNTSLSVFNHNMDDIKQAFRSLGHEADGLILYPEQYHLAEYCSQRLWEYSPGQHVLGPKIGRVLAKTFVCHKHVPSQHLEEHITGVIDGFKMYEWVPVLGAVIKRWKEVHNNVGRRYYADTNPHRTTIGRELEIDPNCIQEQFFQLYGFYAEDLEKEIAQLPFTLGDCYNSPLIDRIMEVDGVSYEFTQDDVVYSQTHFNVQMQTEREGMDLNTGSCFH